MAKPVKTPFTTKEIQSIETMSGYGLPVEKIAAILGISERTFHNRIKLTPEGVCAVLKGRSKAEHNVTATAYELATSGKCPTMTIFWLKCRARWKDETKNDPEPEDDKTTTVYETRFGGTPVIPNKKTNP